MNMRWTVNLSLKNYQHKKLKNKFLPHKVSDFLVFCSTFRNLGTPV